MPATRRTLSALPVLLPGDLLAPALCADPPCVPARQARGGAGAGAGARRRVARLGAQEREERRAGDGRHGVLLHGRQGCRRRAEAGVRDGEAALAALVGPLVAAATSFVTELQVDSGLPVRGAIELFSGSLSSEVWHDFWLDADEIIGPLDDLAALGSRLSLPEGWTYGVRTLETELTVLSDGLATVVQDELRNTYQQYE